VRARSKAFVASSVGSFVRWFVARRNRLGHACEILISPLSSGGKRTFSLSTVVKFAANHSRCSNFRSQREGSSPPRLITCIERQRQRLGWSINLPFASKGENRALGREKGEEKMPGPKMGFERKKMVSLLACKVPLNQLHLME